MPTKSYPALEIIYSAIPVYRGFMAVIVHPTWPIFSEVDKKYVLGKLRYLRQSQTDIMKPQKTNVLWLTRLVKAWNRQDLTYEQREWTALEAAPRLIALKTAIQNSPVYVLLTNAGVKFDWTPPPPH